MDTSFQYSIDRFADLEILRYKVPGFENLTLNQKLYIYYLTEAAACGRDILFDQNYKHNLHIRRLLEKIYTTFNGNRNCNEFKAFETYLKRVWFSNGIHHHYSTIKFLPEFSREYFNSLLKSCSLHCEIEILEAIFNPTVDTKRVTLDSNVDVITSSANNYYSGVTQKEAEDFYAAMSLPNDSTPISYGMNSRLEKDGNGNIVERIWKADGVYGNTIKQIIKWLEEAKKYAENDTQKHIIDLLVDFYTSGDLKTFDEYSIAWVKDTESRIDFVNGFIETYGDALGLKASWESIVNFKNIDATKRTEIISSNAQWFEDNSPVDNRFKKKEVKGVSAKVITNAFLAGDCYPATPIGINLPNANWIRQVYGSKSVTIENIMDAYSEAAKGNGFAQEFYLHKSDIEAYNKYGFITDVLHTDLHECLGHGSGQLLDGVSQDALKSYGATLEEARADLFGLYYMADNKIVELGILPNTDAYKPAYYRYILNGMMTQLIRIPLGENVEEAHMRNRQLIASWVYEKGSKEGVLKWIEKDGKHYLEIYDYEKMRTLFGELLAEVQRIKSEGDYEAGRKLVETYGVIPDNTLHNEVVERHKKLNIAPYKGFVNPVYHLITDTEGNIKDVTLDYTEGYAEQMLRYSKQYSFE
ncbi:MAG: dipeptidyl peptidase 3 [Paludibacteraceae bacterium]|nr:dipeptidyl peptidase 3 [Paludibacteraceae bacterium]